MTTHDMAHFVSEHTGDFSGLPMGWSTLTGGGLELITSFAVDALGWPTEETDPKTKRRRLRPMPRAWIS